MAGTQTANAGTHSQADGSAIRQVLRQTHKHDAADAETICKAFTLPTMRFVPIRSIDQQAVLALHWAWQGIVTARTARANRIRGLPSEIDLIVPQGLVQLYQRVPMLLDEAKNFANSRQLVAWLGLVPKQHSSGGKTNLLGSASAVTRIRARCSFMARAVIRYVERKADKQGWGHQRMERRNKNRAAVALANKNARIVWALFALGHECRSDYAAA